MSLRGGNYLKSEEGREFKSFAVCGWVSHLMKLLDSGCLGDGFGQTCSNFLDQSLSAKNHFTFIFFHPAFFVSFVLQRVAKGWSR